VRSASREEYLQAREIAGQCIVYSRFHLDPHLSKQQGDAVNWAWLDNYCSGRRGEELHVARIDDHVVGFNAILRSQANSQPCRVIDLIGVSRTAQRQGVGQMLMETFIDDTAKLGLPMRVTTQAANIPAVKLYERNDFRLIESALVLHRHVF
jgi:ribosomal protein S18 acetylase RimI-like enzyme